MLVSKIIVFPLYLDKDEILILLPQFSLKNLLNNFIPIN